MVVGVQTWSRWSFSWTNLAPVGLFIPNLSLFWQQHIVLYLKCGVSCESIMHHCVQFLKIMVVGFQPWTYWSFWWTNIALVALYILKIFLLWVTEEWATFELSNRERFYYSMHHWVQPPKMKVVAGFKPWTSQSFLRTNWAVACIYIFKKNLYTTE